MVKLFDIIKFCEDYLEVEKYRSENAVNGLNVEGKKEIKKIALGMSPNLELFQKAKKRGADCIITHHSLFSVDIFKHFQGITGPLKERIAFLLQNKISLLCYHLPLDFHPEIGNNVLILKKLKAKIVDRKGNFSQFQGVVFLGEFEKAISRNEILQRVKRIFGEPIEFVFAGKNKVKRIGVCSGGAAGWKFIVQLPNLEVDLYLTGEIFEHVPFMIKEMKLNFISAGHYRTETFGIQALGKQLEEKFKIKTKFIPVKTVY